MSNEAENGEGKVNTEMELAVFDQNISVINENLMSLKSQMNAVSLQRDIELESDENDSTKNYKYTGTKPIRKSQEETELQEQFRVKQIEYTQHEFVKMNEIGILIQEAIQGVLDKIHQKDRITQANKTSLRKQEAKLQHMEQQVGILLNLTNTVREMFKKVKDLKNEIVDQNNVMQDHNNKTYQRFVDQSILITELTKDQKRLESRIQDLDEKLDQSNYDIEKNSSILKQKIEDSKQEIIVQVNKQDLKLMELDNENKKILTNYDKLSKNLVSLLMKEQEKLILSLKLDSQRLTNLEFKIKEIAPITKQLNLMDDSIKQLIISAKDSRESCLFLERTLPLQVHFQICEGLTNLVQTEYQKDKLLEFDKAKLSQFIGFIQSSEGCQVRIPVLRKRLFSFGLYLLEQNRGSAPFIYGQYKDYWTELHETNQPAINKIDAFKAKAEVTKQNTEMFAETIENLIKKILQITDSQETLHSQANSSSQKLRVPKSAQNETKINQTNNNNNLIGNQAKASHDFADSFKSRLLKTQLSPSSQVITHVKYIRLIDTQKLKMIERKQLNFIKAAQEQLEDVIDDYESRFMEYEDDLNDLQSKLFRVDELIKVIQQAVVDPKPDRNKLVRQMTALEEKSPVSDQINRGLQRRQSVNSYISSSQTEQEQPISPLIKVRPTRKGSVISGLTKQNSVLTPIHEEPQIPINIDSEQIKSAIDSHMSQFLQELKASNLKIEQAQLQLTQASNQLTSYIDKRLQEQMSVLQKQSEEVKQQLAQLCEENNLLIKEIKIEAESKCDANASLVQKAWQVTEELQTQFKSDYNEFVRDRRRWKSDFETAQNRAKNNFTVLEDLLKNCLTQNNVNTQAIKMIIDSEMISQICERQDQEDRKQIGLFGMRTPQQILNPALASEQELVTSKLDATHSTRPDDEFQDQFQPQINKEHQVLKIDKSCLSCSGNMNQVLCQIKIACLNYSQSPVPYKDKLYSVGDLLRLKGSIISECQRMIRDVVYQRQPQHEFSSIGNNIFKDERSYIIEPLLAVSSLDKAQFDENANFSQLGNQTNNNVQDALSTTFEKSQLNSPQEIKNRKVRITSQVPSVMQYQQPLSTKNCNSTDDPLEESVQRASSSYFYAFNPNSTKFLASNREESKRNLKLRHKGMVESRATNKSTDFTRSGFAPQSPTSSDIRPTTVLAMNQQAHNQQSVQFLSGRLNQQSRNKQNRMFSSAALVSQYVHPNLQIDKDLCQINDSTYNHPLSVTNLQALSKRRQTRN